MVQTDDVSRAVLTGGCCDQWKDVEGSPGTVGSLELGESFSLEGAAAALEPKVAAGSKFKGRGGLQWRRLDLPAAWLDRLSHKDWMKTTSCVCTNIYLSLFCRTVLDV